MSATDGHGGPGAGAAVAAVRPVVLVRYRPGVVGETARTVHVVPLPTDGQAGAVGAVCGAALSLADIETVNPGAGMPCTVCLLTQALATSSTGEPGAGDPDSADAAGLTAGGACYQAWGWPVTLHRDQVRLSLHRDVSALAIPIPLCTEVTEILARRRCVPVVLAHPYAPEHRIVLAGERYGVVLPWPHRVHRVTGVLLLPPTVTLRGPITWTRPPPAGLLAVVPGDRSFRGTAHRAERRPTRRPVTQRRPVVRARTGPPPPLRGTGSHGADCQGLRPGHDRGRRWLGPWSFGW